MADLYTRLFEPTVFPMLDRLNGTAIGRKLAHLRDTEYLDRGEIRRRQLDKLTRTLDFTRRHSTFYRELWEREPGPPSTYEPLDGVPIVTKARFQAATGAFPLDVYKGRVISSRTSGSTGSPMVFHRSMEQESWFWALRFRIWGWGGYRPGDPYLTINLNPRLGWKKKLQDRLFRCAYLTFNADNLDARTLVDTINRRRIPYLNGFSSSLYALARFMLDNNLRTPSMRSITATGDTLYPAYRDTIEEAFGVRVLDYYGAGGEGFHLASQSLESGERFLLHPENAIFEIIGPDGPVAPGERGRIIATQLDNDAMPLIRYELGDVAVAADPGLRSPCGRSLPMLERIEGRMPDLVVLPSGAFLVTHVFVVLFKNIQSIHRYQVHQDELDRMRILLVGRDGVDRTAVEKEVTSSLADTTRGELAIDIEWVDDIPLSGAGKRRLVISKISRAMLGIREDDDAHA
ncbi:MAG: hypothetical protein AAGD38_00235 [Acidobacteriota bacterium]